MILTVTPAPAIDLTLEIESLALGAVNRAVASTREASGKGVNVSWALHTAGFATRALFPAGGSGALAMTRHLDGAGLPHRVVSIHAELRTNVTLRPHGAHETKINSPGSPMTAGELDEFLSAVDEELKGASSVVISGSGPAGAPASLHAEIVSLARRAGVFTLVDTSGPALALCLDAYPDVITPNIYELADITDTTLTTFADVVDACHVIRRRGVDMVVVSMGADGALLVAGDTGLWGHAEGVRVVNSVGAGDALAAGLISAVGNPKDMLHTGIWWAASAVESPSTLFELNPELRSRVSVSTDIPMTARVPNAMSAPANS